MDSPKKLILFPCNGNAIEALDCIDSSRYSVIGFVDDDPSKRDTRCCDVSIFDRSLFHANPEACVLAIPGNSGTYLTREKVISDLDIEKDRYVTIIHPAANVSDYATLGTNCLVMEGVVIKPFAIVGDNVCVQPNSVVHHHASIGHGTIIGSNSVIQGYSKIGRSCYLGSSSKVKGGISVGDFALVGMGCTVIRDVDPSTRVAGCPARLI